MIKLIIDPLNRLFDPFHTGVGAAQISISILTVVSLVIIALVGPLAQWAHADTVSFTVSQDSKDTILVTISATDTGVVIPGTSRQVYVFPKGQTTNVVYPTNWGAKHVTDLDITGSGTASVTYTAPNGGLQAELPLDDFLVSLGPAGVTCPWMGSDTATLYCGVDLAAYVAQGEASYIDGQSFTFTDGTCPQIPGMLLGTDAVVFEPGAGFVTDSAYTGVATVYGDHTLMDVPEPTCLTVLVSALLGLGAFYLRRRRAKA